MDNLITDIRGSKDEYKYPFFDLLNANEIELIYKNSNIVTYRPRDVIFMQQTRTSHVMFVKSGLVKIFKEGRMGKSVILNLEPAGNFLGLISVFGKELHEYSTAAVEQTEILFIDINVFKQILKENGGFTSHLLHLISLDGLFMFRRIMAQTHKQLPGRIADVLLYFSEVIYCSQKFSFPFTRRELAELAGTTKESFIRTLTEYKNDKIIELNGQEVEIKSMKIIKTLSELG
jgi:CRP-like cAMP-binding protein